MSHSIFFLDLFLLCLIFSVSSPSLLCQQSGRTSTVATPEESGKRHCFWRRRTANRRSSNCCWSSAPPAVPVQPATTVTDVHLLRRPTDRNVIWILPGKENAYCCCWRNVLENEKCFGEKKKTRIAHVATGVSKIKMISADLLFLFFLLPLLPLLPLLSLHFLLFPAKRARHPCSLLAKREKPGAPSCWWKRVRTCRKAPFSSRHRCTLPVKWARWRSCKSC